ncbi:sugar phosphate nucleotidyltransferase [Rothia sp. LK2588]|uniref:glucose-1-phosphate adenylyltransferase family protein n=1 Tax=Rothia sp. LK2588 TaxID=3114369 RepID=UPI0034CF2F9A
MSDPFPTTAQPPTVALVLAGGKGSRLAPLTDARSKPSVSFGGSYHIIDVVLSNLAHSQLRDVWIVEQYRPFTLNQHLASGRPWDLDGTRHGLRILPPAEGRVEEGFASGNGHALYQQIPILEAFGAQNVVVLSADHLYQLDLRPVIDQHNRLGSDLTVVTTEISEDPSRYGMVQVDDDQRVTAYDYKPETPKGKLVATEVFVFNVAALRRAADEMIEEFKNHEDEDDALGNSLGDYGETIVPHLVNTGTVHEYRHRDYWRDIGTLDSFYQAHMELIEGKGLDLDRPGWPVIAHHETYSPARFGADAQVSESIISYGSQINGTVEHSVIGPGVTVEKGARVYRSVILGDTTVPAGADLESVIADIAAEIPARKVGATKPGPGNITVLEPKDRGPNAEGEDQTTGH